MNAQLKHLVEDYVNFWKEMKNLKQGQGPYIHPADRDYLSQKKELWFRAKDASKYDHDRDAKKIHVDLMPSPYMGDIMNAKIIIFMGNPGIEKPKKGVATPREYLDHKKTILWDALVSTIHQDFSSPSMADYPYLFLNPEMVDTAGGRYDKSMYGGCIKHLQNHFQDGRKVLAKNICKIQLYPYHSTSKPGDSKDDPDSFLMNTPSYQRAIKFLAEFLPAIVKEQGKLIIATRWIDCFDGLLRIDDNVKIAKYPRLVRTCFSNEFKDTILQHLHANSNS